MLQPPYRSALSNSAPASICCACHQLQWPTSNSSNAAHCEPPPLACSLFQLRHIKTSTLKTKTFVVLVPLGRSGCPTTCLPPAALRPCAHTLGQMKRPLTAATCQPAQLLFSLHHLTPTSNPLHSPMPPLSLPPSLLSSAPCVTCITNSGCRTSLRAAQHALAQSDLEV